MKRALCFWLLIASLCVASCVSAHSVIISANSFSQVQQLIAHTKHPHQLLVALDDDDTLTMMPCPDPQHCQYLGGPAWYDWQSALPANNPHRIWKTFSQLLAINNFVMVLSNMPLDDPSIPAALKTADQLGAHIIVVSARGESMLNATETQLKQDGIFNLIDQNTIHTPSGHISFPGQYLPYSWNGAPTRPIAYTHGILYLAGQNKGVMIQQFLQKTNETSSIKTIIFVDDTYQNVLDVANAYKNVPGVNVISVHFTRLAAHKAAFLTGKNHRELQHQANTEWYHILTSCQDNAVGCDL